MWLIEPPVTPADLHFRVGGIPVRVSAWFWLAACFMGSRLPVRELLLLTGALFLSILIHELGHAIAYRYYGMWPRIVLLHFGGLAIVDSESGWGARRGLGPLQGMAISAAGPGLQLVAGLFLATGIAAGGFSIPFEPLSRFFPATDQLLPRSIDSFAFYFLQVSIFWALLNCLPVYPMDGGKIARHILMLMGRPDAVRESLMLSFAVAAAVGTFAIMRGSLFIGIMFGLMAVSNYQSLQDFGGRGGSFPGRYW